MRLEIIVSLRTAASAEAPSALMPLHLRLQGMGKSSEGGVSTGVDVKVNTRAAAHLSSLSTPFSLMQLAMMMAGATPRPLLERSIFSVGFVPLSLSI